MASLFATPITLAYFLAFSFLLVLYLTRQWRLWLRLILLTVNFVALLLTFSKGGYQIAGIGLLLYLLIKIKQPSRFRSVLGILLCIGVLSVLIGYWLFGPIGTTMELHITGLYAPVWEARGLSFLIGHFLGSGGTISARLGADVPFDVKRGVESGIGSLFYQTGLLGVLLYLAVMVSILRMLFLSYQRCRQNNPDLAEYLLIVLAANAGLLVNAFFQENALAPIPASFFIISAGIGLNLVLCQA